MFLTLWVWAWVSISYDRFGLLIQVGLNQAKYHWQFSLTSKIFLMKQLTSDLEIIIFKTNVFLFTYSEVMISEMAKFWRHSCSFKSWMVIRQTKWKKGLFMNTEVREGNQEVSIFLEGGDVVNKILINKVWLLLTLWKVSWPQLEYTKLDILCRVWCYLW